VTTQKPSSNSSNHAQALTSLRDFQDFAKAGISMQAVVPKDDGSFETYKISLTLDAAADLAALAASTRDRLLKQTPINYGPAVLVPPDHVMHVAEANAASLADIVSLVMRDDSAPLSDLKNHNKVKILALRFTDDAGRATIMFRVADSLFQLKAAKYLALVRHGQVYDRLDSADVMLLRRNFDVVLVDGVAFFELKSTFERAFGFLDQLRANSAATFEQVTANLNIRGLDKMKAACTKQSQMMAKMASIRRSMDEDSEYAAAMTMDRLVAFVRERDYIDVDIETEGDKDFLVYHDDVTKRFQLLKLLDDDYLHSILTQRDYESGSKVLPDR